MYLLTNIINMLMIQHNQHFLFTERPPLNTLIKMVGSNLCSRSDSLFFIVPADIVSILVDQNFTMNAIGMVQESL